jgi:anti-sigma regulatory factor (Ser/Thr protein kinase)
MPLTATPEQSVSWPPGRNLTEPRRAREQARQALSGWGLGEHAETAELIIDELVANAICHGTGPVRTRISYRSGRLRMEVHDDGPGRPVRREAAADDESGRGLAVIDALLNLYGGSLRVEDDVSGDGKTVCVWICLAERQ